jgi:hypothetical protein
MAITFGSIHILSNTPVSYKSGVFVSWSDGWQTMLPDTENMNRLSDPEKSCTIARKLSKELQQSVLWFFVYDEDEISFALFTDGKTAAAYNCFSDKKISKVPALVGLEESYRKRLIKILSCTDIDFKIRLLEEFFGVKLLLLPEAIEEGDEDLSCKRSNRLFLQYEAEIKAPAGKKAPIQVRLLFELDGVLSYGDWHGKYHKNDGYLWVFNKHYWLYAKEKHTGTPEFPVQFRDGKLNFITDKEMLKNGTDQHYNESRNKNPLFENQFYPDRLVFSENAPAPYSGKTVKLPSGFWGLGFDEKGRMLIYNEATTFAWIDAQGKMLAKQRVKGDIIDQEKCFLLTWEEKADTVTINGKPFPLRLYGIIRGYEIYESK